MDSNGANAAHRAQVGKVGISGHSGATAGSASGFSTTTQPQGPPQLPPTSNACTCHPGGEGASASVCIG
eukprot:600050-Amphidinium_carterae.1